MNAFSKRVKDLWLDAVIFAVGFGWVGIETLLEQRQNGGTLREAFWAYTNRLVRSNPSGKELLALVLLQAGLLWFTFLSKSDMVTEGHKVAVKWMMAGAIFAWIVIGYRFIFHN
jgi:hypothetical protein